MRPIGWISLGRALIHIIFLFPMDGTGDRFGTTYGTCLSADQASHQFVRARRQRRSQAWRAFCVRTLLQAQRRCPTYYLSRRPIYHSTRKGDVYGSGVSRKSRNAHTPGTTPQLTPQVVFADAENLRFLLVRAIKQIERRASAGPGE